MSHLLPVQRGQTQAAKSYERLARLKSVNLSHMEEKGDDRNDWALYQIFKELSFCLLLWKTAPSVNSEAHAISTDWQRVVKAAQNRDPFLSIPADSLCRNEFQSPILLCSPSPQLDTLPARARLAPVHSTLKQPPKQFTIQESNPDQWHVPFQAEASKD